MHTDFEKVGKLYRYIWIAILLDITVSFVCGFFNKFYNIIKIMSRDDILELVEKYLGEKEGIEFISKSAGAGFGILFVIYLLVVFIYIIAAFGIPNLVYVIVKVTVGNNLNKVKRILAWSVCLLSLIPGTWCTTKVIMIFTFFTSINITLLHLLTLSLIQVSTIVVYAFTAFTSIFINDKVEISV